MTRPGDQAVARFPVRMTGPQRALASLSLAQFTTTLEFTIVFIALPSLGRDLGLAPALLAWVAGTYAVAFLGFLVLGGRLADRFGARRLFLVAATAFTVGSVLGAVAATGPVLLGARGLQGVAAALLQPAILGLMQAVFPDEPVRGRAWGVWASPRPSRPRRWGRRTSSPRTRAGGWPAAAGRSPSVRAARSRCSSCLRWSSSWLPESSLLPWSGT